MRKKAFFTFFTDKLIWYPYQIWIQDLENPKADFNEVEKACFRIENSQNVISLQTGSTSGIDSRPSLGLFLTSRGSFRYPIWVPVPIKYLKHSGINFRYDLLVCATTWPQHYQITTIPLRIWCALNCIIQFFWNLFRIFWKFFARSLYLILIINLFSDKIFHLIFDLNLKSRISELNQNWPRSRFWLVLCSAWAIQSPNTNQLSALT